MTKTQKGKVAKKKKKTPKKIRTWFLEWLPMGIFLFFIVVLLVGFTGAFVVYYNFTDD